MSVYVYAIARWTPALAFGDGVRGLQDLPLRVLRAGDLAVVVSAAPARGRPAVADLLAHARVAEALAAAGPVLPARFGSRLPGDAEAVAFATARQPVLHAALGRVDGRAELAVRARHAGTEPPPGVEPSPGAEPSPGFGSSSSSSTVAGTGLGTSTSPGPGTAYLARRVARDGWVADLRRTVHEPLLALAAEGHWRPAGRRAGSAGAWQATGAYLVDVPAVPRFATAVGDLATRLEGTALTCTGPWPPFSFAEVGPA